MIIEMRAPRLAIVGRRGAGKSSLINAIFGSPVRAVGAVKAMTGQGQWLSYEDTRGKLEILDTRGLGEGHKPDEAISEDLPMDEVAKAVKEKCPDALLFIVKAKEVDARIDEDLAQLKHLRAVIMETHDYAAPIVGIVTQVDELDPADVTTPPFEDQEKQRNIETARNLLYEKLRSTLDQSIDVFPVSAYMRFSGHELKADRRWNIDALLEFLIEKLPKSAQMELARISRLKSVQRKVARAVGGIAAALAGGIAAVPIPLADLPVLVALQTSMIGIIAYIAGRKMEADTAKEFMAALGLNVGAGFVLRELARGAIKWLFPGGGLLISGAVAASATYGICEAAIAYFIDEKSEEETKRMLEVTAKKHELTQGAGKQP